MIQPIDAVISWVDGYDPIYQQKLREYCQEASLTLHQVIQPTRIHQHNEIYYCLHGLKRFAPWLRHIYLLTNAQTPEALRAFANTAFEKKIKLIDQNQLLKENGMTNPVFNSLSIEWLLYKIPGLSDNFLYLNDDFFIIRDVKPEDFFRNDCLVLRGEWKKQLTKKWQYRIKKYLLSPWGLFSPIQTTNPHRHWQEQSAQLAGWSKHFYLLPHAPFPLHRTTYQEQIHLDETLFAHNASYPFRHPNQISSIPLMVHHDIQHHRVVFDTSKQVVMIHGSAHTPLKIKRRLKYAATHQHVAFVCIQSMDEASETARESMKAWLAHQMGISAL